MKFLEACFAGLISLLIAWAIVMAALWFSTTQRCLKAGWAHARVTWNAERYCVRKEFEFENTRPLHEIEGEMSWASSWVSTNRLKVGMTANGKYKVLLRLT